MYDIIISKIVVLNMFSRQLILWFVLNLLILIKRGDNMDYVDFQKIVVEKIKSVSLRKTIENEKTIFQPIELLKIVYDFVEKYDSRLFLLKTMLSVIDDQNMHSYIKFLINELENGLQQLQRNGSEYIFELHIKTSPNAYDERYICNSFSSAISLIDEFYKEYSLKPSESAKYKIVKRKIYDSNKDKFDEDFAGSCTLNYQKDICEMCIPCQTNFQNCDGICFECERLCMTNTDIRFPSFVGYKDLVKYQDTDGSIKYGVCWDIPDFQDEECYIIPLDCYALMYRSFDKAHDFHQHIPYPFVEKATLSDLTNEDKIIFNEYLNYLEKNEK